MTLFFDPSALAKRYLREKGTEAVQELVNQAGVLAVSIICPAEIISVFCRLRREKILDPGAYERVKTDFLIDLQGMTVYDVDNAVHFHAISALESYPLRGMDALHVACALAAAPDAFVSADSQQLHAAGKMGLKTIRV